VPRGNRLGPLNRGPKTGRGAGYCTGYTRPGYLNPTIGVGRGGRGLGLGRARGGRGLGIRNSIPAQGSSLWTNGPPRY